MWPAGGVGEVAFDGVGFGVGAAFYGEGEASDVTVESILSDRGNTCWDCNAFQRVATVERLIANGNNAVRDRDALQGCAAVECAITDRSNAVRKIDLMPGSCTFLVL